MTTQPANEDFNKPAGFITLSRGLSQASLPAGEQIEKVEVCLGCGVPAAASHVWQNWTLFHLLERIPGLAYRCHPDRERTMEYISEGCLRLTGYHSEELIHNRTISYGQLILSEDQNLMWDHLNQAMQKGDGYDLSYRIKTLAGAEKWVREIGNAVFNSEGRLVALEGLLFDITERKFSEMQIRQQIERFEALRKIDMAITGSYDLRVTLDILLDQVISHLKVDAADILLLDPNTQMLEYIAGRGFRSASTQHTRLRLGEGVAGIAALEHRAVRRDRLLNALNEFKRAPQILSEGFQFYYGIPLIAKGQVKGILEVFHRSTFEPGEEWIEFLEALAGQAAIAIENSTLFVQLQRSNIELTLAFDALLESWSKAVEMRDQGLRGHTQRVNDLTLRLALELGIDSADLIHVRRGAILHDIGEISIPDHIFLKPGALTEEEWKIVRQHPLNAYNMLSPIPNLRPALDIPYCHHEKWDGSGYPRGLSGEQIPLSARIFSIVDVWDALLSDRPYRKAWQPHHVLSYLREQSGKHFDPRIVKTFYELIKRYPSLRNPGISFQ